MNVRKEQKEANTVLTPSERIVLSVDAFRLRPAMIEYAIDWARHYNAAITMYDARYEAPRLVPAAIIGQEFDEVIERPSKALTKARLLLEWAVEAYRREWPHIDYQFEKGFKTAGLRQWVHGEKEFTPLMLIMEYDEEMDELESEIPVIRIPEFYRTHHIQHMAYLYDGWAPNMAKIRWLALAAKKYNSHLTVMVHPEINLGTDGKKELKTQLRTATDYDRISVNGGPTHWDPTDFREYAEEMNIDLLAVPADKQGWVEDMPKPTMIY